MTQSVVVNVQPETKPAKVVNSIVRARYTEDRVRRRAMRGHALLSMIARSLPGTVFHGGSVRPYHIVPDTDCPRGEAWRIPEGALTLVSAGPAPHLMERDGIVAMATDYDSLQATFGLYANLACEDPRKFVRIIW